MKKISTIILASALMFMLSCRGGRHVTIVNRSNNYETRLEYSGTMAFSNDRTKLEAISNGGYIEFKRNDDELYACNDHGHIIYKQNGTQVNKLDDAGQSMLREAINIIIKSSR
jgi:hypothetical protein